MTKNLQKPATEPEQSRSTVPAAFPAEILQRITDSAGSRVVLVVGAGVSMEQPTGFKSGSHYSSEAYRRLLADGVLNDGECANPEDLSELADVVYEKFKSQTELTSRLPKNEWRTATPNLGHLNAVALLIEGALQHVITLNYDLAFQHAVSVLGNSTNITFVEGPDEHDNLGAHSVVHLHRSVNQPEESWVLRKSALDTEWQGQWESVIAAANLSAPVVVFVGLGSPANVLTKSVNNIASKAQSSYYLVDHDKDSRFRIALSANLAGSIYLNWGEFMSKLAQRVTFEQLNRISEAHAQMAFVEPEMALRNSSDITMPIRDVELLKLGYLRAMWLLSTHKYLGEGDALRQKQVAHLLLATEHVATALDSSSLLIDEQGQLTLTRDGNVPVIFGLAHGGGTSAWSSISTVIRERNNKLDPRQRTTLVVVAGARNTQIPKVDDLIRDDRNGDLIRGADKIHPIFADEYHARPATDLKSAFEGQRR